MSWHRGDLAVCIRDDWRNAVPAPNPKIGDINRVSWVGHHWASRNGSPCKVTMLHFVGKPDDCCWQAEAFRKPVADDQTADATFTALIRRSGERPSPLPASPSDTPGEGVPTPSPCVSVTAQVGPRSGLTTTSPGGILP